MKQAFLIFLLLFELQVYADDCNHDATTFRCVKYIRNYDADTITFDIPNVHPLIGNHISVRVRHVDTPEIRGKLPCEKEVARTAKKLIENLLKNAKRIDLENADKDKYFRILADVIIDGKSLKDVLLKNNLAYAYEGKTKEKLNWCKRQPSSSVGP
jgi:endonuclease YncB( thermonuclease family)